jgi:hypothetical protein
VAIANTVQSRDMARRPPHTTLLAWLATGPAGHLYGGVADWAELFARYVWARARGKDPFLGE